MKLSTKIIDLFCPYVPVMEKEEGVKKEFPWYLLVIKWMMYFMVLCFKLSPVLASLVHFRDVYV